MEKADFEVTVDKLFHLNPDNLDFENTTAVEPLKDFIGQERAISAFNFGLKVRAPGHNIFAVGVAGSGQDSVVRRHVRQFIDLHKTEFKPKDYCYVHNFTDKTQPILLIMEKGQGEIFKKRLEMIFTSAAEQIPSFFQGDNYAKNIAEIEQLITNKRRNLFDAMKKEAEKRSLYFGKDKNNNLEWMPLSLIDFSQPMPTKEFNTLPEKQKQVLNRASRSFGRLVKESLKLINDLYDQKIKEMELRWVNVILEGVFGDLGDTSDDKIKTFVKHLKGFLLKQYNLLKPREQNENPMMAMMMRHNGEDREDLSLPFKVNVFVDNSGTDGAPIVIETNHTFLNLVGKIDKKVAQGFYFTDHTMIRAGSLAQANGGFLILYASELFSGPYGWHNWVKIKNVLKTGLAIEDFADHIGSFSVGGLKPETIPLDIKVILIGDPWIYYLLTTHDDDFSKLFKVKAEFESEIKANQSSFESYAGFIAMCCGKESLLPFDKSGVAKVIEYGIRLADDQRKISTQFGKIKELLIEANYWAKESNSAVVTGAHVVQAIEAKRKRINLAEDRILEYIEDGTIIIDTDGKKIGQINGLAVRELGELSFGSPICIIARTFCGRAGLINIKRKVKGMSGPIFAQADEIIAGYLGGQYAQNIPLALSIVLSFEQSYGPIEGDSALTAELLTIISSLSGLGIDQGIAITGSMRLTGLEQPVGGITAKVECWFKVCKTQGLTGNQGVIIPRLNFNNLVLNEEVMKAIRNGSFHIYSANSIDEVIFMAFGKKPAIVHKLTQEKVESFYQKIKAKNSGSEKIENS
ncbi:MAG: Peptidase S16 lon domain protein [Candidatus Azambacteria bacterium GW2011_GWA2_42_9]|uniref:endopeptidase La n=3 Tax=Candidatus Azamiibacteriota TaxID=1752741 RepID=A0A0G1BIY7_9BACT|nr:MAG: Peptidase S16 lon domain protein [Candidatus Azambacteria bacterium GW2011_GWB1_42_17]KKS46241.1 MAG: Peptidase S16 lon domain protein [Candidatus Azambacteria bacterium GW2011_GWA1_42_19]KKS75578.1 MAG: Peptidase S16 lon domain protein [Candidatus Azambacteria bacterium GW2011_GWA2_42_9]KKS88815.1 MAG: Peptidase S16 lon domain protein [Parcubacteria group bacterium GW2011_GWC1_43_11]